MKAYILVQAEIGKGPEVGREISRIKGVSSAEVVTGPYDVVVVAEARSLDELGKLVVSKVQAVDGVTRTLTCPVVHDVEGIEPGAYAFEGGELRPLRAGEFRAHAGFLCLEQPLGAEGAATHFLLADLERALSALGDRGYRVVQLAGGIAAGRMYLAAYAQRVGATALTFYDDEVTRFFGRPAEGLACVLAVAVGRSPRLERRR
ncbi:MAG TPA: Lrp/AsnC ligand binding domain-containing protein [Actinomycetota bacterium]|nr:Lrp/AsnC ligand binding domain-containing protein [Actinomycetota bacterium]